MKSLDRPRVPQHLQVTPLTPLRTRVRVHRDNGETLESRTRSKVWSLAHGELVVQVDGIAGCYSLDCVEVVQEIEVAA